MGRRKRRKRPKGFSERGTKPAYDLFTNLIDVHGPEKRTLLNTFSIWIAAACSLVSGFTGCMVAVERTGLGVIGSWIVGVAIAAVVFNWAMGWLQRDRYYRP